MKLSIVILLLTTLIAGCSKTANPLTFEKIEPPPPAPVVVPPPREYTLLELYMDEKVDRDEMMDWLFQNDKEYRYKLFLVKAELQSKQPLSPHDRDRILLLQYGMNDVIRKFNEQNFFSRSAAVIKAGFQSRNEDLEYPDEKLDDIKSKGANATAISDTTGGFVRSVARYGFKIEEVQLIKDESVDSEGSAHE